MVSDHTLSTGYPSGHLNSQRTKEKKKKETKKEGEIKTHWTEVQ